MKIDVSSLHMSCHPERSAAVRRVVEGPAVAFRNSGTTRILFGVFAFLALMSLSAAQSPAPARPKPAAAIRFEDATAKAGIDFVHSFGSRQLGSLLEGTGAGCAWFDYNNDGLPDLYIVNGRPLDDSMHPYPLKEKP